MTYSDTGGPDAGISHDSAGMLTFATLQHAVILGSAESPTPTYDFRVRTSRVSPLEVTLWQQALRLTLARTVIADSRFLRPAVAQLVPAQDKLNVYGVSSADRCTRLPKPGIVDTR